MIITAIFVYSIITIAGPLIMYYGDKHAGQAVPQYFPR